MARKKFQDLNLADAYLFAAALNDPETCRLALEVILGRKIESVEMHAEALSLHPGEDFNNLRPNYVIFICCFDPFGKGLCRYTFTNRCAEADMELEDGTTKVFLNTKGHNFADVPEELVHFLKYVENSTEECAMQQETIIKRIHQRVEAVKKSREWERKYMKFEELLQREHREGREEGHRRMLSLVKKMQEAGEGGNIPMLENAEFFEQI